MKNEIDSAHLALNTAVSVQNVLQQQGVVFSSKKEVGPIPCKPLELKFFDKSKSPDAVSQQFEQMAPETHHVVPGFC